MGHIVSTQKAIFDKFQSTIDRLLGQGLPAISTEEAARVLVDNLAMSTIQTMMSLASKKDSSQLIEMMNRSKTTAGLSNTSLS